MYIEDVKKILAGVDLEISLVKEYSTSVRWETYKITSSETNVKVGELKHTSGQGCGIQNHISLNEKGLDATIGLNKEQFDAINEIMAANKA